LNNKLSRTELIQDVRQFNDIFENAHPDPYINGGGKITYHRRLQELIRDIPVDGMPKDDFFYHIQSFAAKIFIKDEASRDKENPCGVPLYFAPVEDILFVDAVCHEKYLNLIGYKLISVERISFEELVNRMKKLNGFDNHSNLLNKLGRFGMLYFRDDLKELIPEWNDKNQIKTILLSPDGIEKEFFFPTKQSIVYPLLRLESNISIPNSDRRLAYHFIDDDRKIAYLKIGDMTTFREAHELFLEIGLKDFLEFAKEEYEKIHEKSAPEELKDLVPGLPSATELFTLLFKDMKESETEYLMVDLRHCRGGQDYIIQFLLYFLVGFEREIELISRRSDIRKLSEFVESTTPGQQTNLKEIPYYNHVPLTINDYNFTNDKSFAYQGRAKDVLVQWCEYFAQEFKKMPSFYKVFQTRAFEAYYLPKKIIVLCSDVTHSSGYDLMTNLNRIGAVNIGVPSGQSGNHYGNIRRFELTNSKIIGKVATTFFIDAPDKPMKQLTLYPDYPLTYEYLASLNFDENIAVIYALDLIKEKKV